MVNVQSDNTPGDQSSHSATTKKSSNNGSMTKPSSKVFSSDNKNMGHPTNKPTSTTSNSENAISSDITTTIIADPNSKVTKPTAKKQNRNRLSFVCQACRRSKTKCDREKPSCTRCVKMNIECVYDVAKQPRPRIPNKDATIAKLEKDVVYWQNKAMKLLHQQQETIRSLRDTRTSNNNNNSNNINYNNNNSNNNNPNINVSNTLPFIQMTRNVSDNNDDKLKDVEINLYKDHPTMILSKVMKHDVKPLSENYIIIQDRFMASCIASAFMSQNSNSMIPALTANANISRAKESVRNNVAKLKNILMKQCIDPARRARIEEFTDRILENTNSSKSLKIGMILSMLYNTVGHQYLEDYCTSSDNYSDLLKSFIQEFERLLPPYEIIQSYKKHFYQYVYPNLPFLQKEIFEESISQTITSDPNDSSKIKLNLGCNHLRDKIENLSILMVILKLSYISLREIINYDDEDNNNNDNNIGENGNGNGKNNISLNLKTNKLHNEESYRHEKKDYPSKKFPDKKDFSSSMPIFVTQEQVNKYPISNDFILIAQRCLASENWFACANENIITCLLFIWSFFAFSPEEGDFFLEHPTDIISSLIMMLSTSIGLHRDPSDYTQLKEPSLSDQRLLNQRRLLWVSVVGICSFESTLKGRHPLLSSDLMSSFLNTKATNSIKHYMERVSKDMTGSEDEILIKIHEWTVKRAQLSLLLADLDSITMSYKDTFSLRYLELSREKIEIFIAENFPLIELEKRKTKSNKKFTENFNPHSILMANKNSNALQSILISKLMFLRTSAAIYLHFEVKSLEDSSSLPYYYKYLIQTASDCLNLIKVINDFFSNEYHDYIYKSNSYNITKIIQLALPTALFTIIGIIIRLTLTNNNIFNDFQTNINSYTLHQKAELNMRFEHTTFIQRELENTLEWVYAFASQNLRFTYFSIFKLFAVGDVVLQRIRNGEIWQGICKLTQLKGLQTKITKNLRMTLGVNIEQGEELIQDLEKRNFIEKIPIKELTKLCKIIHDIHVTIKKPLPNSGEEQKLYVPPTVQLTLEDKYLPPSLNSTDVNMRDTTAYNEYANIPYNQSSITSLPIMNKNYHLPYPYNGQVPNYINNSVYYHVDPQMQSPVAMNHSSSQMLNLAAPVLDNNSIKSISGAVNHNNFSPSVLNGSLPPLNVPMPSPVTNLDKNTLNSTTSTHRINTDNFNNALYNNSDVSNGQGQNDINTSNLTVNDTGIQNVNDSNKYNDFSINESMAKEFLERTRPSNEKYQDEFFGGFDLFDYDFLFGNDFS